jgi:hypothetical protein
MIVILVLIVLWIVAMLLGIAGIHVPTSLGAFR